MKDGAFCDAADIIKNATEELKMLSQNGFSRNVSNIFTVVGRNV